LTGRQPTLHDLCCFKPNARPIDAMGVANG
jgi:hypothetical protein